MSIMKDCEYETVNTKEDLDADNFSWKYFLRQVMISSSVWVTYFVCGLAYGAPTVFIPKIRKENKDAIDESMQTWLASMFGFAALPWVIILTVAAAYTGRKYPFAFSCITMLVGSIVLYCSTTVVEIIGAELLLGVVEAAVTTVAIMVLGEYISPKYRGMFLTFKSATFCWGIWISNAIGTFFHWKNIPLVMIILSIYPNIVIFFWPESPYFLASKSKYEKCTQSHRWLKVKRSLSITQLFRNAFTEVIESIALTDRKTTDKCTSETGHKLLSTRNLVSAEPRFFEVVLSKRFYKAFLLSICLVTAYTVSGKHVCTIYSIDIIKKLTSSENTAYTGMLILDGVTIFSMYVGSILSKIVRRRVLFISFLSIGIISLFTLSAHVYLVQLSVLQENGYITLVLLSIYSIGVGSGPILLSTSLVSEILPLQYKSFAVCAISFIDKASMGIVVKLAPMLIRKFGLHVAFFAFGLSSTICLILFFLYMPETKDKTLIEISDEMQGINKNTYYKRRAC